MFAKVFASFSLLTRKNFKNKNKNKNKK